MMENRAPFIIIALIGIIFAAFIQSVHKSYRDLHDLYIFPAHQYCNQKNIRASIPIMNNILSVNTSKNRYGLLETMQENHSGSSSSSSHAVQVELFHTSVDRLSVFRIQSKMQYEVMMARTFGIVNMDSYQNITRSRELYDRLTYSMSKAIHNPAHALGKKVRRAMNVKWHFPLANMTDFCGNHSTNTHPAISTHLGIGTFELGVPMFRTRYSNLMISFANLTELGMTKNITRGLPLDVTDVSSSGDDSAILAQSMILYNEFKVGDKHDSILQEWCPGCVHSIQFPGCDRFTLLESGKLVWERFMNAHPGGFFPITLFYMGKKEMARVYAEEFNSMLSIIQDDSLNFSE